MRVSRRMFLGAAAAAPVLASGDRLGARCAVVDLGCVLPESLEGFKRQVGDLRYGDADALIIPGVGALAEPGVRMIQRFLERGATVLLECSLGIPELGIEVGGPVRQAAYFPYVEYRWPVQVKIREFTPVWFEPAPGDEVIGGFAGKPVALSRRMGPGTLVAIGSPLGPVFLAGDPDARRWLNRFFALSNC
jgi:hypothetical protein